MVNYFSYSLGPELKNFKPVFPIWNKYYGQVKGYGVYFSTSIFAQEINWVKRLLRRCILASPTDLLYGLAYLLLLRWESRMDESMI